MNQKNTASGGRVQRGVDERVGLGVVIAAHVLEIHALVGAQQITRLAANGFGEFQPVNTDDTDEARAQNRRIELKLTEK